MGNPVPQAKHKLHDIPCFIPELSHSAAAAHQLNREQLPSHSHHCSPAELPKTNLKGSTVTFSQAAPRAADLHHQQTQRRAETTEKGGSCGGDISLKTRPTNTSTFASGGPKEPHTTQTHTPPSVILTTPRSPRKDYRGKPRS